MTVLTDRHANSSDFLVRSRRFGSTQPPMTGFPLVDTFEGEILDPQSLHKYAYVHGDPVNMIDPTGMFGLAGFSVGMAFASGLREMKIGVDMAVFDAVSTTIYGVQAGMSASQIFQSFLFNQMAGFGLGFAAGKILSGAGALWENGIAVFPARRSATSTAQRPFVIVHSAKFTFPKSGAWHSPKAAPELRPIDSKRLSRFNAIQRPRIDQWIDWTRKTRGVVRTGAGAPRLDQAQVNAAGRKISGNRPDFQFTLEGGTYTFPNGAQITVPPGSSRRVYIELDPFHGGRTTEHTRNLIGDDPDSLVVLDVFDDSGLINSIGFNNI